MGLNKSFCNLQPSPMSVEQVPISVSICLPSEVYSYQTIIFLSPYIPRLEKRSV